MSWPADSFGDFGRFHIHLQLHQFSLLPVFFPKSQCTLKKNKVVICHLTCIGLTSKWSSKIAQMSSLKGLETILYLWKAVQVDFVLYCHFPWVSSRGYSRLWDPFWLHLRRYIFNFPLPVGKSECWSACLSVALWVRFLPLHLYLKCSCSLPRICGPCGLVLGREEQLPWH